jgi:predicted amino acid dehydrogenase
VAAAIGHLESADSYSAFIAAIRGSELTHLRVDQVERFVRRLEPMPICNVFVRSPTGAVITAAYVDAFLLPDASWGGDPLQAVRRVQAAYRTAAQTGARLVALGGFSSIIGEMAHLNPSREYGIAFTTGNSLTAAVIAEQVFKVLEGATTTVTVVGAAGDVGSGVCRILHSRGLGLRLVGRRREPLEQLASELRGASVWTWDDAAPESDLVVLVSSSFLGEVSLDGVPTSAVVLDAGHPPNASAPPGPAPRYARAGRVRLQYPLESDLTEFLDYYSGGELHSCLAEGLALALEDRWESFSSGRGGITSARAADILGLAARHGIEPAPLRFAVRDDRCVL